MGRGDSKQLLFDLDDVVRGSFDSDSLTLLSDSEIARRSLALEELLGHFQDYDEFDRLDDEELRQAFLDDSPYEMVDRFLDKCFEQMWGSATYSYLLERLVALGVVDCSSPYIVWDENAECHLREGSSNKTICEEETSEERVGTKGCFNRSKFACKECRELVKKRSRKDPVRIASEESIDTSTITEEEVDRVRKEVKRELRSALRDSYLQKVKVKSINEFIREANFSGEDEIARIAIEHFDRIPPPERFRGLFETSPYTGGAGNSDKALFSALGQEILSCYGQPENLSYPSAEQMRKM
jgi:hypothetical protein